MPPQSNTGPIKHRTRGPIELIIEATFAVVAITVSSWFIGCLIETLGANVLWKKSGVIHARQMVVDDLQYIAATPRSLLIDDTQAFSIKMVGYVQKPYEFLGILSWYQRSHASQTASSAVTPLGSEPSTQESVKQRISKSNHTFSQIISELLVVSMFVLQDTILRECIAIFALPAFTLACLLGIVDGLMRRDLRRWGGGRESSFIYHHAKRYTVWALTGGFALYLTWPFGGFNPSLMVFVFTALVAVTLSTTVATFKKYA
jgi:integrating conjugative element membrane protein (TIGR03747 family)